MNIIATLHVAVLCILLGYVIATAPDTFGDAPWNERYRHQGRRPLKKERSPRILLVLVFIVSLIFIRDVIVGSTPFGISTIGSVLEKRDYRERYFVYAFPEGSEEMSYRVEAEIHAYMQNSIFGADRIYELEKLRMPDGSSVAFSKLAGSGYSLEPHRIVNLLDDNGRKWRIELTEVKAE